MPPADWPLSWLVLDRLSGRGRVRARSGPVRTQVRPIGLDSTWRHFVGDMRRSRCGGLAVALVRPGVGLVDPLVWAVGVQAEWASLHLP